MSVDADILVVDDERSVREGLCSALAQAGYRPRACESVASARQEVERCVPDCVLLDIRLKDGDGLQLLEELRATHTSLPVIIASAYGDSERTIHAMKHGAFDYVTKPFDLDALLAAIARAVRSAAPAPALPAHENLEARLLGSSPRMLPVWKAIGRAALSDAPVLITGETGVGKELVARAIHDNSKHSTAPFVAVNIAALPEGLIESEVFGHERGAFTGALARREGRFESAAEGTLFLDEIGDLTIGLQTKLLRVTFRTTLNTSCTRGATLCVHSRQVRQLRNQMACANQMRRELLSRHARSDCRLSLGRASRRSAWRFHQGARGLTI